MHFTNGIWNEDGDYSVTSTSRLGQSKIIHQEKLPRLNDLGTLQKTLAPITTADLFKDGCYSDKPKAYINIGRFLSREGRVRQPSSLKASAAEFGEGVISLSTGRPLPETYPFERMEFAYSSPKSVTVQETNGHVANRIERGATVQREDPSASIDLSVALSYGYNLGSEQLIQYLTTHVSHVHSPPYSDWEICLTIGNTSALEIAFRNFTDPGDFVLVEEYTYSGMIEAAKALGLILFPVAMDADGINPESMDRILSKWDQSHLGKPKPKVLYTIPTGHNPTGITQPRHRRLEILNVAEKHDILIIEDDPYYYLHFSQAQGKGFLSLPSYLSLSTTGRVIRLDTTSKILAPGLRLGWLTAPKAIVETFQAAHDLGIVHPSGVSQLVVYKLLSETWGHDGFLQWLNGLASTYQGKATAMLHAMEKELHTGSLADICSWSDVQAGMFIWLKIDCNGSSKISQTLINTEARDQALLDIEHSIYAEALKAGVLCCKGSFFRAPTPICSSSEGQSPDALGRPLDNKEAIVFLRLTFASAEAPTLVEAIKRLGMALRETFTPASPDMASEIISQ